jgi:LCP family protein required for cell wall assembly
MKSKFSLTNVLIAIGLIAVFGVSFVGGVYAQKVVMPQGGGVDISSILGTATDRLSTLTGSKSDQVWLIAGLDTVGKMNQGGSVGHNDTLILAFIRGSTVNLLYIPRDSLVEIPGVGITKVTHTSMYGGVAKLIQTLKQNFGVTVDHYVVINFTTVIKLVDMMGGLTVDVPQRYCYQGVGVPKYTCINKGTQTLNGTQFLVYWRVRDFGSTHISDLDRISRQISLITGTNLKDQVISKLSPSFISNAVNVWSDYVVSDMNLVEVASMANKLKDAKLQVEMLPGDAYITRVVDLGVPVSVYQWDAQWLKNWYTQTLGAAGQAFANQVNPPKVSATSSSGSGSSSSSSSKPSNSSGSSVNKPSGNSGSATSGHTATSSTNSKPSGTASSGETATSSMPATPSTGGTATSSVPSNSNGGTETPTTTTGSTGEETTNPGTGTATGAETPPVVTPSTGTNTTEPGAVTVP